MQPGGRVALRIEQDTPCPGCGYNLRGMRLDANCPECGRPTLDTFARPLGPAHGELAERMVRIPATAVLWLALLGFVADLLRFVPAALEQAVLMAGLLVIGGVAGLSAKRALDTLGRSKAWDAGPPVSDVVGYWTVAVVVAAGSALALPATALFGGVPNFPTSAVAGALFGVASLGLLAALYAGGSCVSTLLQRFGHGPGVGPDLAAMLAGGVLLLGSAAVPILNLTLLTVALAGGFLGLLLLLIAWRTLLNKLREAQGALTSLGRPRRQRSPIPHERPFARR